jgi:hypothetical protein
MSLFRRPGKPRRMPLVTNSCGEPYFLRTVNIADAAAHFADLAQGKLPFEDQEPTL